MNDALEPVVESIGWWQFVPAFRVVAIRAHSGVGLSCCSAIRFFSALSHFRNRRNRAMWRRHETSTRRTRWRVGDYLRLGGSRMAGGRSCQQPRRGAFLRASLTAYNPKGDTLRTERSMLQCGLAISITGLAVLATAITATAAPYTPKYRCYNACEAKCAAQHSCERANASQDCFSHYNQCKAACRSSCSQ